MQESILFFSNDKILEERLRKALRPFRVELTPIPIASYNQPLGVLAGLQKPIPLLAPYQDGPLDSTMLVFSGISNTKLDKLLQAFRAKGLNIPYKAMLTPTNRSWTPARCFAEIKREHQLLHP